MTSSTMLAPDDESLFSGIKVSPVILKESFKNFVLLMQMQVLKSSAVWQSSKITSRKFSLMTSYKGKKKR